MIAVRPEEAADYAAVAALHHAAFGRSNEGDLVVRLRASAEPHLSLVAVDAGAVIGHVFFSPVRIDGAPPASGGVLGLAPMAVMPQRQRTGVGSHLVRAGLAACRARGAAAVVVLGHAAYYPRFGFVPGSRFGLRCEYGGGDAFMALELAPGALTGVGGLVRYLPDFASV